MASVCAMVAHTLELLLTRTLLVALSLACLEMSFVVKGPSAVILLFRLEYKTSVVCHSVYTQKVKIARRDRPHILAAQTGVKPLKTFYIIIDIAPLRSTLSGIYTQKIERCLVSVSGRGTQQEYTHV